MTAVAALYDIAASGGVVGGVVAAAFFLVLIGVAFILFLALWRTLKIAFRLVVVGIIFVIAVVGSVSLWYFVSDGRKGPVRRPSPPMNGRR